MGEVRCPMCGKTNPDELDVCQYCEARLKPLLGPIEPADTPGTEEHKTGSVTDWLESLRAQEDENRPESAYDDYQADETPDESSLEPEDADTQQPESDWLSRLRSDRESDVEADSVGDEEDTDWQGGDKIQDSEIPDWLSTLGRVMHDEEEIPSGWEAGDEQEDALTVTSGIEGEEPETQEQDLTTAVSLQEDDEISQLEIEGEIFEASLEEEELAGELVDDEAESLSLADSEAEEQPELAESSAEIPDWLAGFVEGEPVTEVESTEVIEPKLDQVPDWLTELEDTAGLDVPVDTSEAELEEAEAELLSASPGGLDYEAEPEPFAPPEDLQKVPPFTLDVDEVGRESRELPEWLSEAPVPDTGGEELPLEAADTGLTPAELPEWMQSMRPVEAAAPKAPIPDLSDRSVESRGPLAGLRGVLPFEPETAQLKKPLAYAIKLQVSENQRNHARLFEELIATESVSAPVEPGVKIASQNVLRIIIFLLLFIAVGWPIYSGSQTVDLPQPASEINQASQLINGLTVSEPVLLAVDYEPGFSGEMDAASAAIVDHLMIRGVYLALVSTMPTGPVQAERLINQVNMKAGHSYQAPGQYSNLGYVPGGSAGLLGFARTPRQITPFTLDGAPGWEAAPLGDVQTLADFAAVIVITDSPETARTWVEQVQPTLLEAELIMVVSAQAEPLVRPYYEGFPQQVQGLVTGLAGGAAYERGMPRTSLARTYWDALSYGLALTVLLIVIGSIFNSISGMMSNRKQVVGNKVK